MKKVQFILSLIIFSSILSGCGNSQRSNIIPDPGGNISDMVNIRDKAQQDVANAIDKKNEEINNVINESNMNNFKAPEANAEILAKFNAAVIKTSMGDINVKLNGT
ncbi:MAG TPA: hypothetical protein VK255_00505, partial [Patescibacteria group bacterium]|nr:hypothetical protein [Patescibacteria group bacterium]